VENEKGEKEIFNQMSQLSPRFLSVKVARDKKYTGLWKEIASGYDISGYSSFVFNALSLWQS
jgi:hypothetical protein